MARLLWAEGHVAYFAGGCVRDRLRGEAPKDYDIATAATPAEIKAIFPRAIGIGEAFGVMLVRRSRHSIEVATFRSDSDYHDGRRPSAVRFGAPEDDARRRDFTINGLFEDPRTGEIIDFVGGREDLRRGLVRAIGDPADRLSEDRLRSLRAVRFAARFGYAIEPSTRAAIALANDLRGVSRERVGHELRRMLSDGGRAEAVVMIESLSMDAAVLQEAHQESALRRIRGLPPEASFETALGAWLLDRGESAASTGGSPGADVDRLRRWRRALVLSNAEAELVAQVIGVEARLRAPGRAAATVGEHSATKRASTPSTVVDPRGRLAPSGSWDELGIAARKRLAAAPGFAEALALLATVDAPRAATLEATVQVLAASGLSPVPLIDGDDLSRDLGLRPGPRFRSLLDAIYDAQLEGRIATRADAMRLAAELAKVPVRSSGTDDRPPRPK